MNQGEGQASIPDILNDDVIFSGAVPSSAHHSPVYATVEPEGEYMDGNAFMELDSQEDADDEEVPVYCICRKPEGGFMICCEVCNEWYHGRCVGIEREMGERLPQYTCHVCNNGASKAFEPILRWNCWWLFLPASMFLSFEFPNLCILTCLLIVFGQNGTVL